MKYLKYVYWAIILISLFLLYRFLPVSEAVDALKDWVGTLGVWGPVVFGLIYVLACVLLIPASLLTLAGGAIFGLGIGVLTVSVSSIVGATLAFLIGRYLARSRVEKWTKNNKTFGAIADAVTEGGWKVVAMLRLSPAVPFTWQNYLLGVTGVKLLGYVLASWVAMLPGTVMYVYLGAAGGQAASGGLSVGKWVLFGVGLVATVVLTVYLTKLAKAKLAEQTDGKTAEDDDDDPESNDEDETMNEDEKKSDSGTGWKLPAAAVVMAALAGCAAVGGPTLTSLFGPPAVTMKETYPANPAEPVFDHSAFTALLADYVDAAGGVDYAGLTEKEAELDAYLQTIAKADFESLGRDEKLALLINTYNAATLRLMTDHPGIDSIQSIPAEERWDDLRWMIAGKLYTLKQIENEAIRPNFIEPRIHWALVCAAVGCPPLRNEAYTGAELEEQLDSQTRKVFTRGTRWYEVSPDEKTISVVAIMNWYGGDFKQTAGSVPEYVAPYDGGVKTLVDAETPPKVKFLPYSWMLNSQENIRKAAGGGEGGGGGGEGGGGEGGGGGGGEGGGA